MCVCACVRVSVVCVYVTVCVCIYVRDVCVLCVRACAFVVCDLET